MDKVDKTEEKIAGRAILYRNPEGNVEELLTYVNGIKILKSNMQKNRRGLRI